MTGDMILRLIVLCIYATTCVVCAIRVAYTHELRARVGNVAFASVAGVAWWSQWRLFYTPVTLSTWLLAAAGAVCVAYLLTLARRGL